ncbi:GntR family transcriptional regulator [Peribacillus cavernae]|uniref:GntR family transcriptional regulator n=1 Tax=Peribacillus cavernae TaxID=1674310 RepID=A0A3S0UAR9_9BACI|nr:GntR family transcriptional regulator [Peribacillus cavernae]MDQ0219413.1 DNA-binding GntR family transcriptional regulator [Peribacillus cavernae]RUQ27158.1 GntR family transcriptional regulator [Peribacillus cavernae]
MKKKIPLNEIAYVKIKEKIMRGDFIEENYTSQNQLVEELEMSRTPIVAALQRLQQDGFLKVISNQGIIIQELSIKEINNIFDMRLAIELFSLNKIIGQLTEDDFKNLDEIIEDQQKCCESNDYFNFAHLDGDFHQYLLQVEDNSLFIQTMSNIKEKLFFNSTNFLRKRQSMMDFIQEHVRILEALKRGNTELAVKELEEHLQKGKLQIG